MRGCERSLPRGQGQGLRPDLAGAGLCTEEEPRTPSDSPAPPNVSHSTVFPTFSLCMPALGLPDH